ncbi:hypothetical protein GQ607_014023, partial [Colletotrichum asianum]
APASSAFLPQTRISIPRLGIPLLCFLLPFCAQLPIPSSPHLFFGCCLPPSPPPSATVIPVVTGHRHRHPCSHAIFSFLSMTPLRHKSNPRDIHPHVQNYSVHTTEYFAKYSSLTEEPSVSSQPLILRASASASHFAVRDLCWTDSPWRSAHSPPPFQLSHSSPSRASVPNPSHCHSPSVALLLFLFLHSIRSTITTLTVGRVSKLQRRRQQNPAQPAHICTVPIQTLKITSHWPQNIPPDH